MRILFRQLILLLLYFAFLCILPEIGNSQSFRFGRNKVQYTDFDWQILKTAHFDIYYYSKMRDVAEKGAVFAEESYSELQKRFNYSVNRRIPLIFYSSHLHFQQTNVTPGFIPEGVGGFFEFMKGRVVVPGNGDLKRFRRVIRHELVHVFMHAKLYNVLARHDRLDASDPPLWFTEGLAEIWSGGWDSQAEMVMKDAVLNGNLIGLEDIYAVSGTFFMYKLGQDILTFISERYGSEKILLLMENIWKYERFEQAFQEILGLTYKEFDIQYFNYLKKRYYPIVAEQDFNAVTCPTIVRQGYNFKPVFYDSEDGETVLYVGNHDGYSSIYQSRLKPLAINDKETPRRIIKGEATADFESFHVFDSKIDISKSGILIFSAKSGENDNLYLHNITEGETTASINFDGIVGIQSPAWSPDGHEIVFSGLSDAGYLDLYIYRTKSQQLFRLTNDFYADTDPIFSPDANAIIFSSDRSGDGSNGATNLVLLDRKSGATRYLTYGKQNDKSPAITADGKYLVYSSDQKGTFNLFLIKNPLDVNNQQDSLKSYQLSNFVGATFDPCWADSNRILFSTFENSSFQIRSFSEINSQIIPENEIVQSPPLSQGRHWEYRNIDNKKVEDRKPYSTNFTLDFAQSQVSQDPIWGTSGGAQFAFTDVLGNEQYYLTVFNNARASSDFWNSFNVAVQRVSLKKRLNTAVGIYRLAGYYYNPEDFYYYEEMLGGSLTLSYPLSHFSRISLSQNVYYSDKDWFFNRRRQAYINSGYVSYIFDNSIWGPSGPMDGSRINITLGNTFDFAYSRVSYLTGLIDLRKYYRLSLRNAYAVRVFSLFNEGKESRQFYFGGSWDLRLYRRWSMHGKRIFLVSQEIRFPLVDMLALRFPFFSMGFRSIRGALFLDAGNAWNERYEGLKGSFGLGIRLNLGRVMVFRWDIGRKTDFNSISNSTETHFFFGWDF